MAVDCFFLIDWLPLQDWLNRQTMYLSSLQTSLTLGRDWLTQMGQGAAENGLTIQYCMSMSKHILQSQEIPVVTQVCQQKPSISSK